MDKRLRYQGSILGLAACDALGTTVEFCRPGTFEPMEDITGGGVFGLKAGEWTDDTSMALCLATSLVECRGFNPLDQMQRYLKWFHKGYFSVTGECFDIGNTTMRALDTFARTREPFSGDTRETALGNGSIMRLAPVPLYFANNPEEAIEFSGESSRTTHGNIIAIDACKYLGALITGAINGESKEALLKPFYSPVAYYWDKRPLSDKIKEIAGGSFRNKKPPEIKGSGYVVESLEAALWAFYSTDTFKDGALAAVNLGDDADTTGAVYGQLAGAFYGVEGIPENWIAKIAKKDDWLLPISEQLFEQSKINL